MSCFIVPPHILRNLTRDDDETVARAARHTLTVGRQISDRRVVKSVRPRRTPGATLLPGQHSDTKHIDTTHSDTKHIDTKRAETQARAATSAAAVQRTIYDAKQSTTLPGTKVRKEGGAASSDAAVNQAYDGLGDTWSLYWEVFKRNSLDDKGLALLATVHYDKNFDNAYWDGEQMVFGDGDGVYFQGFTSCIDVIGHELTHGVTQFTAGLTYVAQSGALNESLSDVFGSMVKQRVLRQSAAEADWLIGEGLFTAKVKGVALRSVKAPGTAYDDPNLGKDPQPADMSGYQDLPHDEQNDNGGVHINSGIPNRAFYLAATGIGGNSWEGAGPIWYHTLTEGKLAKDVDFAGFAAATIVSATTLYGAGSSQVDAVTKAWSTVGVTS